MLKNILDNVLSSGSNVSDDKIKELINNIKFIFKNLFLKR